LLSARLELQQIPDIKPDNFIFEKALLKVKWTKKTSESFVAAIRSYHMIFCEERATEIR